LETSKGNISITKNVIGRIVMQSVKTFQGKVAISNHKGRVKKAISSNSVINDMDITMGEHGLDLRIYVVINFGTSIGDVTNTLIEEIYTRVKELTGIEPGSVAVVVAGMALKKQTARRNIEVKR